MCSKQFPEATMKKMVQISGQKAYAQNICPACLPLAVNNPNYYYAANAVTGNEAHSEEWTSVIQEANKYAVPPQLLLELIRAYGKAMKNIKKA